MGHIIDNTNPNTVDDESFLLSFERHDFCAPFPLLVSPTKVVFVGDDKRMRFLHKRIRRMVAAINTIIKTIMTETATMTKYSNRSWKKIKIYAKVILTVMLIELRIFAVFILKLYAKLL